MNTVIQRDKLPDCPPTDFNIARESLRAGDILLTRKRGWLPKITSRGMKSVWTHVGMLVKLPNVERWMVIEGSMAGVRIVPLRHYVSHYGGYRKHYPGVVAVIRAKQALNTDKQHDILCDALDKLGAPYDWREISRILYRWFRRLIGYPVAAKYLSDHKYICSELTRDMLIAYGIDVPLNENQTILPGDFADATRFDFIHLIQVLENQPIPMAKAA